MSSNTKQSKEHQNSSNKKRQQTLSPPETNDGHLRGSILKKSVKYEVGPKSDTKPVTTTGTTKIEDPKKDPKANKLTFSEELNQVKEVDNWKKYNVEDGTYSKSCCNVF